MDADNELARSLGRLEGKVDLILECVRANDVRISAVEKKVWYASGSAAVLGALAAKLGFSFSLLH